MLPQSVKRVLIVHQGAIGDFILSLPAIASLREHYQKAHFEIAGFPKILSLAYGRYYADKVISIDGKEWAMLYMERPIFSQRLVDYLSMFDLGVIFTANPNPIFVKNLKRAGLQHFLQIRTLPSNGEQIHITDYILSSLNRIGLNASSMYPRLYLTKSDRLFAEGFLKEVGIRGDKTLIAIHPGSGGKKKVWMPERFVRLVYRLSQKLEATFLIISGPADECFVETLLLHISSLDPILIKNLPLPHVASIIERCGIYIGNDSGITHMAASLAVPTIAIYGPTDPEIWGPRGPHVSILASHIACSPCSKRTLVSCDSSQCLASIDVDLVMKKALELLKN